MNPHQAFLLSAAYDHMPLDSEHLADLRKSGLTDETIHTHRITSVPVHMIDLLAGFPVKSARSAYLIPFPDPAGGWMDYVKMKVFNDDAVADVRGDEVEEHRARWRYNGGQRKYIVRRQAAPRLYFPIPTMRQALEGDKPLWMVEGMKKGLAAAQVGIPAVAIESAWTWRAKGSTALLPDFTTIRLKDRVVELVPDSDVQTNPMIAHAMRRLAEALRGVGARPRLVKLPAIDGLQKTGMDDYLLRAPAWLRAQPVNSFHAEKSWNVRRHAEAGV